MAVLIAKGIAANAILSQNCADTLGALSKV
jgi:hypothetical protein